LSNWRYDDDDDDVSNWRYDDDDDDVSNWRYDDDDDDMCAMWLYVCDVAFCV
jgi:hypothetical protein